jgi:hypothetical protein
MRELVMPKRVTNSTRTALDALAWASYRRGNNPWQGDNVAKTVVDYLNKHNVPVIEDDITPIKLGRVMRELAAFDLATTKNEGERGAVSWFQFHPELDLSKARVGMVIKEERLEDKVNKILHPENAAREIPVLPLHTVLPLPDVPPPPPPPRYRAEEINTLLDAYAEMDSEAYATYADRLLEVLRMVTNG